MKVSTFKEKVATHVYLEKIIEAKGVQITFTINIQNSKEVR